MQQLANNNNASILSIQQQSLSQHRIMRLARPYRSPVRIRSSHQNYLQGGQQKKQSFQQLNGRKVYNIFNGDRSETLFRDNVEEEIGKDVGGSGKEAGERSRVRQLGYSMKIYDAVGPLAFRRQLLKFQGKDDNKDRTFNNQAKDLTKSLDNSTGFANNLSNSTQKQVIPTRLKLQKLQQESPETSTKNNKALGNSLEYSSNSVHKMMASFHDTMRKSNTVNQSVILSGREKDEQNMFTKDDRTMNRYKEYKDEWERQVKNIKSVKTKSLSIHINRPQPSPSKPNVHLRRLSSLPQKTLLQNAVQPIYVQPNRQFEDILNNNVTRYWEMSLRGHDRRLLEYMKGTKYQGVEFEEMLQTTKGLKEVEKAIPSLRYRKSINGERDGKAESEKEGRLVVSGRKKNEREKDCKQIGYEDKAQDADSGIAKVNQMASEQEVYKISYDARKHWLGTEGL